MTPDFQDTRSALDASGRLAGAERGVQRTRIPRETLLTGRADDSPDAFSLPSLRAETGALLERQLLISGGLEGGRPPWALGERRFRLMRVFFLFSFLAVLGAASGLCVHYQSAREEWRNELTAKRQEIALARAANERLVRDNEETALRLREATGELVKESNEKRRIAREADRMLGELNSTRNDVRSLQSQIGDLKERYRKLEAERLSEIGTFVREALLRPLERLKAMARVRTATVGPVPKVVTTGEPAEEEGGRNPKSPRVKAPSSAPREGAPGSSPPGH